MKEGMHVYISYGESAHETMKVFLTPAKMKAHNLHDTGEESGIQKNMVTCPGDLVMGPGTRVLFLWVGLCWWAHYAQHVFPWSFSIQFISS